MRLLLAYLILSVLAISLNAQTKATIALHDLASQGAMESGASALISDRLRSELFNTGAFTVIERGQMDEILKEQGFQQSGACNSDACIVQVGQLLGVKFILVGTIGKIGSTYTVNVRMIDVATGKIVQTANSDCRCEIDDVLSRATVDVAKKIAKGLGVAPAVLAPPKPEFGTVVVKSTPSGAKVQIDGTQKGTTPLRDDKLSPGKYPITLELDGYKTVSDKIKVVAGETTERSFSLKLLPVPKAGAPKHNLGRFRLIVGGGALLCVAAGIFYNSQAQKKIDAAANVKKAYDDGRSNVGFDGYSTSYNDNISSAKKNLLFRNIVYGLGAVGVAGVGISFAF